MQEKPRKRAATPAAERALAEAEARRLAQAEKSAQTGKDAGKDTATEVDGPTGPDPTRYGDWEKGGIASDF